MQVLDQEGQSLFRSITKRRVIPTDPLVVMTKKVLLLRHYLKHMPLDQESIHNPPSCYHHDTLLRHKPGEAIKNQIERDGLTMKIKQLN